MTVYVDDMKAEFPREGKTPLIMSHMIADNLDELHGMASRLGLRPEWCHNGDHYDVSQSKRADAVKLGAVKITLQECAVMAAEFRRGRPMPSPAQARAIMAERWTSRGMQVPEHLLSQGEFDL